MERLQLPPGVCISAKAMQNTSYARVLTVIFACAMAWPGQAEAVSKSAAKPLSVQSRAIALDTDNPRQTRFGRLEWIGTLQLTAKLEEFGGFSALALDGDGKAMLALNDMGQWLRAKIGYAGGKPDKILKARMGKLTGPGGRALKGKTERDAEGLAMETAGKLTGTAYISFERKHRIAVHKVTKNGIGPARRHLALPKRARSVKRNSGLEAIAKLRSGPSKGALLAFTEEYLDKDGDHVGWLLGPAAPRELTLKRRGGFAVTDMTGLDNGDVIVLERRFRFSEGVKMRLRRIRAADIRPGARLDGDVLFKADQIFEIDNMEGIASHTDATGRTILTLISDDNFNRTFQRTLLMQFAIVE